MDPFSSIKSSLHQGSHSTTFHPTSQLTNRNHIIHYIHEYPLTKKIQGYLHLLFKNMKDIHTLYLRWISFSTTKFSITSQKSPSIFSPNFIPISMITCCHRLLVWLYSSIAFNLVVEIIVNVLTNGELWIRQFALANLDRQHEQTSIWR